MFEVIKDIRSAIANRYATTDVNPNTSAEVLSVSNIYGSRDFTRYNPDELIGRKGYTIYSKMMKDEQIKAAVRFRRNATTSRKWAFEFDEDIDLTEAEQELRISVFKKSIEGMPGSFKAGLNKIMASMTQGFSITEKTFGSFEYKGTPYWGVKSLSKKPFETFEFITNEFGELEDTIQAVGGQRRVVDMRSVVHMVHNPDEDEQYGQSELREAYRSYFSKDILIKLENIYLERMAGGLVWAQPTGSAQLSAGTKDHNDLKGVLRNIQTSTGILMPKDVELHVESPTGTDAFERAIAKHNLALSKSLLMPNMLGISEAGPNGSRSLGETQLEAFLWVLDAEAGELSETLDEQLFKDIGDFNFNDGKYPKFKFKPLSQVMANKIAEVWGMLVDKGAVEVSDSDESYLRELLDMPDKDVASVRTPTAPDAPTPVPSVTADEDGTDIVDKPDETIMGSAGISIDYAKFTKAQRRVDFAAIDRSSDALQFQGVQGLAQAMDDYIVYTKPFIDDMLADPEKIGKFKAPPSVVRDIKNVMNKTLNPAWSLGLEHARREVSKAGMDLSKQKALFASIEDQAAEYIKGRSFNVAGKLSADATAIIQNVMFNGVKFSKTTDEIVDDIYMAFASKGIIDRLDAEEALGQALEVANPTARLETTIRTSTFDVINEARFSYFTDPALNGFVTALEYSAILDGRTTEICQQLDDKVYGLNSSEWEKYRPPNHFNCRSLLVPVTIRDEVPVSTEVPTVDPQEGFA